MNCTCYDVECDYKIVQARLMDAVRILPKLQYKLVECAGDYYYEKMSVEETFRKAFIVGDENNIKCKDDIDNFVQDNLNNKMPLDGPLWRVYCQNYPLEDGTKQAILIFKMHHSIADGISCICMMLMCSNEYDRSFFVKSTDANLL